MLLLRVLSVIGRSDDGTHGPAGLVEEVLVLEPQVGQRRARARVERCVCGVFGVSGREREA